MFPPVLVTSFDFCSNPRGVGLVLMFFWESALLSL